MEEYYPLALAAAKRGDLSDAARLARISGASAPARRLLGLCLYELGDTENAAKILAEFPDLAQAAADTHEQTKAGLDSIAKHIRSGKWRAALKAAEAIPHQSVRMLNIRGCILAGAKRYAAASKLFAQAQQRDGQSIAQEYLMEAVRRKSFWGL